MLAGFAFGQLTTGMPEDVDTNFWLEFVYLFLTCVVIGLELAAIILSTALSVWGPSLALRGKGGTQDLHRAIDCLRDYQELVFLCFMVGWILYFFSVILMVWLYFRRRVAFVVSFPLAAFVFGIFYYTFTITNALRLDERDAVSGKIEAFQPYEHIGDLDHGLKHERNKEEKGGFCTLHQTSGKMMLSGPPTQPPPILSQTR